MHSLVDGDRVSGRDKLRVATREDLGTGLESL